MQKIWAETALTPEGWQRDVLVSVDSSGVITSVEAGSQADAERTCVLLPAPVNLHSHAFQRAMAGLTERRGEHPSDSFWTWRKLMYRFLDHLTPEHVEAITAFVQMEMLEAGYAAVAEFHYLHHQPGGMPYGNLAELSARISAAAAASGIGLTLLPVLYEHGGCDGRALGPGQIRFGNDPDRFGKLWEGAKASLRHLPSDANIGVAPHSLRAVSQQGLKFAEALAPDAPIHMHLAEQVAEVEEVEAAWGKRPADWLMSAHNIDARWCLIHCTQMTPDETVRLAQTGAVAGLCPITESSLGDGIFDGLRYVARAASSASARTAISASRWPKSCARWNIPSGCKHRGRAMLATPENPRAGCCSTARVLVVRKLPGVCPAPSNRACTPICWR
jgi:formimidoylglutamate deiminase